MNCCLGCYDDIDGIWRSTTIGMMIFGNVLRSCAPGKYTMGISLGEIHGEVIYEDGSFAGGYVMHREFVHMAV